MIDTTQLSTLALELIERLAADHEETEGAEVGTVALVVEINGTYDDQNMTWVEYRCSDSRRWVQIGLFDAAQRAVFND